MKTPPASIWVEAARKLARSIEPVDFSPAQQQVLDLLAEYNPELYWGVSGTTLAIENVLNLSQQLKAVAKYPRKELFNFLARGIELGNRKRIWDVPLSPFFHSINREKNLLRPKNFHPKLQANALSSAFVKSLENPLPESSNAQFGQILLSAILFGGLLDSKWLAPFLSALNRKDCFQHNDLLWLEMKRSTKVNDESTSQRRRWIADPLTQLLIYRFFNQQLLSPNRIPPSPWKTVSAYLKLLGRFRIDLPSTLTELRRWSLARQLTRFPASLIDYAWGNLPATSLPAGPWLRILTGKAIPIERPQVVQQKGMKPRAPKIHEPDASTSREQLELFHKLQRELKTASQKREVSPRRGRQILHNFLQTHQAHSSPVLQLLIHWGRQLLNQRQSYLEHRKTPALKVSSVVRYYQEIGEALLRTSGVTHILHLEPQDFEVLYENAASRREKSQYMVHRLTQFHGYLQVFYQVSAMEWTGLLNGAGKIVANVDANLVSPHLFDLLLASLGWRTSDPTRWEKLHLLAAILAYRCGMRPGEIKSLRLIDIQGITEYEVLVRNNQFKSVKTNAGIRRIPLNPFLTKEELAFVLDFLSLRRQEVKHYGGELLLGQPGKKNEMLADEGLFAPIQKKLRKISKDETLRFYHLRHSFLTLLNLNFSLADATGFSGIHLLKHSQFSTDKRNQLKTSLLQNEGWGRKHHYLLAMLAGHNSPKTSYRHYVHFADWFLGHQLRQPGNPPTLSSKALMTLTDYKRAMAFRLLQTETGEHALQKTINLQTKHHEHKFQHPLLAMASEIRPTKNKGKASKLPSWESALERYRRTLKTPFPTMSAKDWILAEKIYLSIQKLDGRQLKTVQRITRHSIENISPRWKDIEFKSFNDAREMARVLMLLGISPEQTRLVHHPPWKQNNNESKAYARKWADSLSIPSERCLYGEHSNLKTTKKHGTATLKIAFKGQTEINGRVPKGSPALKFIFEILSILFQG